MEEHETIKNPKLLKTVYNLKKNYSIEKEEEFYKELRISKYLLPIIIKSNNKIAIVKINDASGKEYLPSFTDWENFQLVNDGMNKTQPMVFTFYDYIKLLDSDLGLNGLVINPYSHNLVLSRENIQFSKEFPANIEKGNKVSVGIPEKYPHLLVNKCKRFFSKECSVECAFLLQMVKNNQISLLLVIGTKNTEEIFPRLDKYIGEDLANGEILDIVALDSEFGRNVTAGYTPFYKK
ncbi:enhanced serine sensitivity protein SseB C-terminal domain-containing protein [Listeria seeligeri]|uniref:enhanced serine sensitivity protein SseB C-terminal domain-containing protein n=1 Tax=Listeria seeligeri TaxID=1640 RepID=UPI0001C4EB2F|nr:enhanced serine sensitivity protein SseB C-terminal domain-containing protein [Listeria seeligeri]MBC1723451.1 enhanced serine sensitivity protein SseB [Listeria seeligeri]MBF2436479.1 enhanced serine sensitivity protein SseB [Listeria seeligeri]CBH28202.1 hypothetical protein lse_2051 [Listeria seeligeri serovar 1/2b str. SLCC3954]